MSKKKALFYTLEPVRGREDRYVTMHFFDRKERKMLSSVDLILNLDYLDDQQIAAYVSNR